MICFIARRYLEINSNPFFRR